MATKLHIICGMCGSAEDMTLNIYNPVNEDDIGYHFDCDNCSTICAGSEISNLTISDNRESEPKKLKCHSCDKEFEKSEGTFLEETNLFECYSCKDLPF